MRLDEAITDYFKANSSGIVAVYLFGSQASGKTIPTSDVDVAVLLDRNDADFADTWMNLILSQLPRLLRKDIHPVIMNSASEMLLKQIFGKGRCLLVNDSRKHSEFKMLAFTRIADFNYYLKKMQAGFVRRVLEAAAHG
jgi:predicted nucleotidyltransferase